MTEKNKELGREALSFALSDWNCAWIESYKERTGKEPSSGTKQAYEQIKHLIQQSGEKPEIDEKYIKKKAEAMHFYMGLHEGVSLAICEEFVSEIISEVQNPKITDDLLVNIIDAVLEHVDCHHTVDHDEDGIHTVVNYSLNNETKLWGMIRELIEQYGRIE